MNKIRYLTTIMLALWCGMAVVAQSDFNPANPADPGVPPQQLLLAVQPAGAGSVSGAGRYVPEQVVTVRTSAATGWRFVRWTDEEGYTLSTSPTYSHTKLDRKETLTAWYEFNPSSPNDPVPGTEQVYYRLTVKADDGGTVSGGGRYQSGTRVSLRANVNTGYEFAGWVNEDGVVLSTSTSFYYTTTAANETLTATFRFNPGSPTDPGDPILRHRVTVIATDGGTVSGSYRGLTGTSTNISAYANTGYDFVGWYVGGTLYTTQRSFTYTVGTEDITFEARFNFNPGSPGDPAMPMDKLYSLYLMSPITYPGRNVDCIVYLSNQLPVCDMRFNLTFPEGLEVDADAMTVAPEMAGYTTSIVPTGEEHVYTVTLSGGTAGCANREILRVPVIVGEEAALGTNYQLRINQVSITQDDGNTCSASTRNGRVSIYKRGDSNGDGEVNITDYVNLIDFINYGQQNDVTFIMEVSNVSGDDLLNITDAVGIIEIINESNE